MELPRTSPERRFWRTTFGIDAVSTTATTTTMSLSDSVVSGGTAQCVEARADLAGSVARVFVTRSTIDGCNQALVSSNSGVGSSLVTVSGSTIANNGRAWNVSGGGAVIKSLGNNHIQDNTNPPIGTLTSASLQ